MDEGIATGAAPANALDWSTASLAELIRHIVSTHHEYLKRELPVLDQRLSRVAEIYREQDGRIPDELLRLFEDLQAELSLHMRKEEMILFPAIEACDAAARQGAPLPPTPFGSLADPIHTMEMEHASAAEALARIGALASRHNVPSHACGVYRALMEGLAALTTDLREHLHLENDILFPRAIAQERAVDSRTSAGFGL